MCVSVFVVLCDRCLLVLVCAVTCHLHSNSSPQIKCIYIYSDLALKVKKNILQVNSAVWDAFACLVAWYSICQACGAVIDVNMNYTEVLKSIMNSSKATGRGTFALFFFSPPPMMFVKLITTLYTIAI